MNKPVSACITFLALFFFPLFAEDNHTEKKMRQAQIDIDVDQPLFAQEIYQQQIDQLPNSWRQVLVRYNLGTSQLLLHRNEAAVEQFRHLNNDYLLPEELSKKVSQQLGYALYLQAEEKQKTKKASIDQIAGLFHDAMDVLDANSDDPCCQPLFEAIRVSLGNMLLTDENKELQTLNLRSKTNVLLKRIDDLLTDLTIVESHASNFSLPELAEIYRTITPYWMIPAKISPESEKLFSKSEDAYKQGLDLLQSGQLEKAKEMIIISQTALDELRALLPQTPFLDKIDEANDLLTYARQMSLIPVYYQQNLQKRLKNLAEFENLSESSQKQLSASQGIYDLVLESQKQKQYLQTHYYLLAASQRLMRAAYEFDAIDRFSPQYILETALQEQQNAYNLVIILQELSAHMKINDDMDELTFHVQSASQTIAEHFTPIALAQQQKFFNGNDPAKQCQDKPWNDVFPLFYRGLMAATTAGHYLQQKQIPYKQTAHYQMQAIQNWQEALSKLKKSSESSSKSSQPPPNLNETDQTTQSLIEMDLDDSELFPTPSNYKMVDRPW